MCCMEGRIHYQFVKKELESIVKPVYTGTGHLGPAYSTISKWQVDLQEECNRD